MSPDIIRFVQCGRNYYYYSLDGKRVPCQESIINHLWFQWLQSPSAKLRRISGWDIFTVQPKDAMSLGDNKYFTAQELETQKAKYEII